MVTRYELYFKNGFTAYRLCTAKWCWTGNGKIQLWRKWRCNFSPYLWLPAPGAPSAAAARVDAQNRPVIFNVQFQILELKHFRPFWPWWRKPLPGWRQRCWHCLSPAAVPAGTPSEEGSPVARRLSGAEHSSCKPSIHLFLSCAPAPPPPVHPLIPFSRQSGGVGLARERWVRAARPCAAGLRTPTSFAAGVSAGSVRTREAHLRSERLPSTGCERLRNACYLINLLERNIARNTSEISPDVPLCVSSTLMWTKSMESEVRCPL